jgi:DNA-binding GntR family transcriptional regulator
VPTSPPPRPRRVSKNGRAHTTAGNGASPSDHRVDNVSRAYEQLRGLIVWGQLPPGARIAERSVAERLATSRTPVRSALHRLLQEGFVAAARGRNGRDQRLIVAPVTKHDGEELFIVVGHLEGLAARTAAGLPAARRKAITRRMRALNREIAAEARKRGNVAKVFDLDVEFHGAYVEGVVGPRLLALHRAIKPQTERYARMYISVLIDALSGSVREHEGIVRCIADGDEDGAQRAAETNWRNAATRLARVIETHGERGSWHAWKP